jgi:hypothetical protein
MSSFLCTFFFYRKIRCFTAKPEGLSGTLVLKSGAHEQTGQSWIVTHRWTAQSSIGRRRSGARTW